METGKTIQTEKNKKTINFVLDHIVEIMLIIVIIALSLAKPSFMTLANWLNIFRNISMKGIIAFGMLMVIVCGQIDLSIGSQVGLSGVIVAWMCRELPAKGVSVTWACIIGMLAAILVAFIMGTLHGYAQHKFRMPAFIVTLATQNLMYGLAGIISGGFPIANTFPQWFIYLGTGRIGGKQGVPVPAVIMIVLFIILWFVMNYTTTGRAIYASGGNAEAARLSGVNVLKTKIIAFISIQVMCVLAGFMNSAQVYSGSFSFGRGWEVDVISAVVIGGTSMDGGIGKAWGTLVGIVFLGVIINGMTILDISTYMQYVIRAVLMFTAVMVATYRNRARG